MLLLYLANDRKSTKVFHETVIYKKQLELPNQFQEWACLFPSNVLISWKTNFYFIINTTRLPNCMLLGCVIPDILSEEVRSHHFKQCSRILSQRVKIPNTRERSCKSMKTNTNNKKLGKGHKQVIHKRNSLKIP